MDNKPCKNCGSYGGNVGCDVCGPPIRERIAKERLARTPCSADDLLSIYREALLCICATPDKGQLCDDAKWMKGRAAQALKFDKQNTKDMPSNGSA